MKSSSRDLTKPRRIASSMASPRAGSVWYTEAVSKCLKPSSIAWSTARTTISEATGGKVAVPSPNTGILWPEFRTISGTICKAIYEFVSWVEAAAVHFISLYR
ncbi:NAD(P)-linked oxidoreductase superfamily protein [Actinidia rufa]|uniref:NAD(P)-linked oxidoreductase superfamily protein n=1 Tax=Actinidia rufa TaxID=165716 RepID=A0A7J0DVA1_9ERIC|nr:NAD(P)-linked oxidoreductase superfamily protein [Actinidia rufa]